jgi:hypothetical protein
MHGGGLVLFIREPSRLCRHDQLVGGRQILVQLSDALVRRLEPRHWLGSHLGPGPQSLDLIGQLRPSVVRRLQLFLQLIPALDQRLELGPGLRGGGGLRSTGELWERSHDVDTTWRRMGFTTAFRAQPEAMGCARNNEKLIGADRLDGVDS